MRFRELELQVNKLASQVIWNVAQSKFALVDERFILCPTANTRYSASFRVLRLNAILEEG